VQAVVAAILTAAVTALYWHLITGQGSQGERRPQLVAISLLAAAALLLASTVIDGRAARLLLLSAASSTLVIWAFLGVFSIGVLLLPAAWLGLLAASRASALVPPPSAWMTTAGGAAAALLLAFVVLDFS
jgi:ABC-type uncharacterized transport system permease subunit